MTSEQRPPGGGYGRDSINSASSLELPINGIEKDGFRGPMAPLISEWQQRGLGRAIGVPLVMGGITFEEEFQGVIYALPISERGKDPIAQQSLLLFPTKGKTRFLVVTPQPTFSGDPKIKERGNARAISEYSALLAPSKKPYIHPSWRVNLSEDPAAQFLKDYHSQFPFLRMSHEFYSDSDREDSLSLALKRAMDMEVVDVEDGALRARLSEPVGDLLAEMNDIFSIGLSAQRSRSEAVSRNVGKLSPEQKLARLADLEFEPNKDN